MLCGLDLVQMLSENQKTKVNLKEHMVTWFGRLNYVELLSLIFFYLALVMSTIMKGWRSLIWIVARVPVLIDAAMSAVSCLGRYEQLE